MSRYNAYFARIEASLRKGAYHDELLSGREFDRRYWTSALAALRNIERQLAKAEREREAFKAWVEHEERA